ncbi:MAG TPA: hypothetical protein VG965_02850 [Patescibacteria group bacterium]|nr:hypothetical protein [Patescibacteria group bacterium]
MFLKSKTLTKIIEFLPYIFVFISSLYPPSDPDLGWHLRYGEYFFKHHKLLYDNTFSTMMQNYHWANGSWGFDLLIYFLYRHGGFLSITLFGGIITTFTYALFAKVGKFTVWEKFWLFPIFIFLFYPLQNSSFKGEDLSLFFLGILILILAKLESNKKLLYFIPLFFLAWFNFHEESFIGLAVFYLWVVFQTIKKFLYRQPKSDIIPAFISLIVSTVISTVNPYGTRVAEFALSHIYNPVLLGVSQYVPFSIGSELWWEEVVLTVCLLFFAIYLIVTRKAKNCLEYIGIVAVFLVVPFFVKRYIWLLYALAIPFTGLSLRQIRLNVNFKVYQGLTTLIFVACLMYSIFRLVLNPQLMNYTWKSYCSHQLVKCSDKAASVIANKYTNLKLYSYYDWGGWLIWSYPQIKPNIDGRMHEWTDTNGYSAFEEYTKYELGTNSIDKSTYNVALIPLDNSPLYYELDKLVREGSWKLVYEDDNAAVVVRNLK